MSSVFNTFPRSGRKGQVKGSRLRITSIVLPSWVRLLVEEPTEVFTSSYTQCTWFFILSVAGPAGNCGNAQNLKRIYSLLTHRVSTGGFYTVNLVCNIMAKHGRALMRRKKKALTHSIVSLSAFIVKPQNAKPADRIPQTTLQSNSGLQSFAAYRNYFHTIPAFFQYKIQCPFLSPSRRTDEWQVSPSIL